MPYDGTGFEQQDKVLDLLLKARGRIVKGWCKEVLVSSDEEVCIIGALHISCTTGTADLLPAMEELYKFLPLHFRPEGMTAPKAIINYNDYQFRAHDDVIDLYDRAIAARIVKLGAA